MHALSGKFLLLLDDEHFLVIVGAQFATQLYVSAVNEKKRSKRSSRLVSSLPISAFERFVPSFTSSISSEADLIEKDS